MNDPQNLARLDSTMPVGRIAQPGKIGAVAAVSAGDGARYVTATTVFGDGGIVRYRPSVWDSPLQ